MAYAFFLAMLLSAAAPAKALGILVPAYFDPGPGSSQWDSLALAAQRVPLCAIMNPNNGPSSSAKPAYLQAIRKVRTAGGRVIGYVYSSYSKRPIADVKADIDRYQSYYELDGFFVDEMTNDGTTAHLAYYEDLYLYIKEKQSSYWVVGNPGINSLEIYLTRPTVDALVTFENNTGYNNYRPDAWTQSRPATVFSHLCYAVATPTTMSNYVQLARSRNAGYIYVTDDGGTNPWDSLPTYWDQEVTLIEQLNRAASSNQPPVLSIFLPATNRAQITVSGVPGRYVLRGSTNLKSWEPVSTNVTPDGQFSLSAPGQTNHSNRLYRAEQ
jgi:hypothetical protein